MICLKRLKMILERLYHITPVLILHQLMKKKLEERTRSLIRTLLFSILKNNRYDDSAFIEMINPHLSNPDLKKAINDYLLKPDYNNDKVITELILKINEKNQEK